MNGEKHGRMCEKIKKAVDLRTFASDVHIHMSILQTEAERSTNFLRFISDSRYVFVPIYGVVKGDA